MKCHCRAKCFLAIVAALLTSGSAPDATAVPLAIEQTAKNTPLKRFDIGVNRRGTSISALISQDDLNLRTTKTRVLLVAGLSANPTEATTVLRALEWFSKHEDAAEWRKRYAISAVPFATPDPRGPRESGYDPRASFPPPGRAYDSSTPPEAAYLWRWIGMHAPDVVVEITTGDAAACRFNGKPNTPAGRFSREWAKRLGQAKRQASGQGTLADALGKLPPCNTGMIPGVTYITPGQSQDDAGFLPQLLAALDASKFQGPSKARKELIRRAERAPLAAAKQLAGHYGHRLRAVQYIPAVALIGRLRLGELTEDASHQQDVAKIVEPWLSKSTLGSRPGGSHLSGHLIFTELARRTKDDKQRAALITAARAAADLGFDEQGKPKRSMPFHSEMSDAVFMGCPILVQTGALTGEKRYFDMALTHFQFMRKMLLRKDGLYRHSPMDEAAWGRGNGFPALGLALCLSDLPEDHAAFQPMRDALQNHLRALAKHQDATGMWHQVIDHPESYRELSCTCMITFAMLRGMQRGWLSADEFAPVVKRSMPAILQRVATDGTLVDVCTGTGKQKNLRAYYDRPAILGKDDRGGAMSLLVLTEAAGK